MLRAFFICFVFAFGPSFAQSQRDSLATLLSHTMKERPAYEKVKRDKIDRLNRFLETPNLTDRQIFDLNDALASEYAPFQFDSAMAYLNRNLRISRKRHDDSLLDETRTKLGGLLSSSGNYAEAISVLATVKPKKLSPKTLTDYYNFCMEVYARLSFYSPVDESRESYREIYNAYADSALARLSKESDQYLFIVERRNRELGKFSESLKSNDIRLKISEIGTRNYSRAAFSRSLLYDKLDDVENRKKYLTLAAVSDIRGAIKDNAALTELAMLLFKENEIERAHELINFSFEDAAFYNSRLRYVAISNIIPIINKAYEDSVEAQQKRLRLYIWIISALVVVSLLSVFMVWRQLRNLRVARNRLEQANLQLQALNEELTRANIELNDLSFELGESNQVKEHYIGNFLNICSGYIDKLDGYRKTVKKMIASKKTAELYDKANSEQFINDELKSFYEIFDKAFLDIYPDFVRQVNALLTEGVQPKKGELLSTELRIFALIRLGVTDSASISRVLRYSVNTIYNYRVKIKNKAKLREEFESDIAKIGLRKG